MVAVREPCYNVSATALSGGCSFDWRLGEEADGNRRHLSGARRATASATWPACWPIFWPPARTSLHLAIYDFRLSEATRPARAAGAARTGRRRAWRSASCTTPASQSSLSTAVGADPAPPGTAEFVSSIGGRRASRSQSRAAIRLMPKLMHHKYVVRDGQTPAATLWTGSTNFTDDSWTLAGEQHRSHRFAGVVRVITRPISPNCGLAATSPPRAPTTPARCRWMAQPSRVAFAPGEGRAIDQDIAHRIGGGPATAQTLLAC